jgi:hypothetical protein
MQGGGAWPPLAAQPNAAIAIAAIADEEGGP